MNNPKSPGNNNNAAQGSQKHVLDAYTVQPKSNDGGGDKSPYYHSAAPSISLPKGGGALKGIDEKFSVNAINGTAGLSVPLPLSPGRAGFTPSLALSYNSGSGNSEFGLGWGLGLPSIQRKTDKQLPLYDDVNESDVFLLAGAEDLVPQLRENGDEDEYVTPDLLFVKRYRPRIEGLFARIEFIKNNQGASWWRVTTKDNITTWYGYSAGARLSMPGQPANTFKWLPELIVDGKGNVQHYTYKAENADGVPMALHERNRRNGLSPCANLYLKQVRYCNLVPYYVAEANQYTPVLPAPDALFLMEAVMDYGEHANGPIPVYQPVNAWEARTDPFSDFHAGFEIRTYRRCHRVLMFHRFEELTDADHPEILVRSLDLTYQHGAYTAGDPYTEADLITAIIQTGYQQTATGWLKESLPAMTMEYEALQWNDELKKVSPADTRNAPQGLTGPYQWTDLLGEGLPGILSEQGQSWWYKENLGNGHFSPARPVAEKPSFAGMANGTVQWQDLDADGRRQVVIRGKGLEGFFELDDDQHWQGFQPFKEQANVDWNSPYTKMLDLNGDGRPDLLLTNDTVWTWYENEGKTGFTEGGRTSTVFDEEKGPRLVLNDKVQSIYLADMSGDGMTDIVRIKNGEVCYWPNMGYGKFGAKIAMTNAPVFARQDLFNPLYLQLTDISGTGAADLVYLGDTFRAWINLAGNAFSEAHDIATLPGTDPYSKVALLDFLGNGTGCIVWSSPLPQHSYAPMRYIDLMGGKKPYLMHTYHNGMGKSTTVAYKSSTQFYLEDKAAGTPWATHLPFPVQCIDTISTNDAVSGTTFTQRYSYHHGYYDHEEREFRGFGRVDVLDTDSAQIPDSQSPIPNSLDQPPVLTKTWYHTGAWMRDKTLLDAYQEEYYQCDGWDELATQATFPVHLTPQEQREAYRALKGSALRQEVYALDGDVAKEPHPYTVTVSGYAVRLVQGKYNNRHASLLTYSEQSLAFSCERNPHDTRVAHTLSLEVDEYGNVLQSAQVAYPRRAAFLPSGAALAPVAEEQEKMHIVVSTTAFTNDIGAEAFDPVNPTEALAYRLRLPYQSSSYELYIPESSYPANGTIWALDGPGGLKATVPAEVAAVDYTTSMEGAAPLLRLLGQSHSLFADDAALNQPLALGVLSVLAIPYQQYTLAFTVDLLDQCFGYGVVTSSLMEAGTSNEGGGYVWINGQWWVPSGTVQYGSLPEGRFYTPVTFVDPWGNQTGITYWESGSGSLYYLLPATVTDAKANASTVTEYNWRNLQPKEMLDANNNRSAICYDVLGMPVATAIMGKATEADYLKTLTGNDLVPGMTGDGSDDTAAQAAFWDPASSTADVVTAAKTLLGKATWRTIYNFNTLPIAVAMIGREEHYENNASSPVVIRVAYSDSFGRIALNKAQCEPVTITLDSVNSFTANWICSGKTVYNNKGKAVMQYEPFFCHSHFFSEDEYNQAAGVSPRLYYDPLGRPYRTEMPDGTYTFTTWDNWMQTVYDANDTTSLGGVDSPWFFTYHNSAVTEEIAAAAKAYAHRDTPTRMHLDTLARPFLTAQDDGSNLIYSHEELDITGNRLTVIDGNGQKQVQYRYNMIKAPYCQSSIDGGDNKILMDVAGKPLIHLDAEGRKFWAVYDCLRRPLEQWVDDGVSGNRMLEKTVYSDTDTTGDAYNQRGNVSEHFDGGGRHYVDAYDFKGLPLASFTNLLADVGIAEPDWNAGHALSSEIYVTIAGTDALGRVKNTSIKEVTATTANTTRNIYDQGGQLKEVRLTPAGSSTEDVYVRDIHYDAKGQRKSIWYGNGTKTKYTYDPLTYRLTRLCTVRLADNETLQQLKYWYDAVGNITQVTDEAQQVIFYDNARVRPEQTYTYDALYRLIEATGREMKGDTTGSSTDNTNDAALMTSAASPFDGNALQNYIQRYKYDAVGNMTSLVHSSGAGSYTRRFTYMAGTNRLSTANVTNNDINNTNGYGYNHDARGNIMAMPHLSAMAWNSLNQLSSITTGTSAACYQYSGGERIRKLVFNGAQSEERIYLGNYEVYRRGSFSGPVLERTTVHISDDTGRIAMLEMKTYDTSGTDAGPAKLSRYIYSNHLQSSGLELDENGAVISYEEYHPYGTTSYQAMSSTIKATAKRYRFTGKERDEESGLNYHGARYYAPWLCRWIRVDPLESEYVPQSPYIYCSNNPITRIDPDGKGDYYSKDGTKLGSDNKTVTEGKGKKAKQVSDDKAYVSSQPTIDKFTKDGVTDWDKVIQSSTLLGISNSTLGKYAHTIVRESGGDKKESFAIASAIMNLSKFKGKDLLNTMKTERMYGYDGTTEFGNAEYSMEAAINALTNGTDYSNKAIRWDGFDLAARGFKHPKAKSEGGIEVSQTHYDKFKAAWPDEKISAFSNKKYTSFATDFSAGMHPAEEGYNKGRLLFKSTAVEGTTMFWGVNEDPVIKKASYHLVIYNPNKFPGIGYFGQPVLKQYITEIHLNAGYTKWKKEL